VESLFLTSPSRISARADCREPAAPPTLDPVIRQTRVRRRVAQTPVVRYENRTTGRTVTLVATMHVGTNAYFSRLNEIVAGLEAGGAVICYEGIRAAPEGEWALAKLPSGKDAVLLWGGGHLPGLAAGLKKAGYQHRGTTWVPVGELPAVWPSLRAVWAWL
jgi:hypothetical protein